MVTKHTKITCLLPIAFGLDVPVLLCLRPVLATGLMPLFAARSV
jgi:hypothetical protein